jgi:PIN domain nuclease of toxin-antitoxin system
MLLLDTHVLAWMDADDAALGSQARQTIRQAWSVGEVAVSAISFWEVAMLAQRGRLQLPVPPNTWRADLLEAGVREIPLDGRVAVAAAALEGLHRDPADRFIIATALASSAVLVTADSRILDWAGELSRVDARR